jgi:hypothetical protein
VLPGLFSVVIGTAWAVGGTDALRTGVRAIWTAAPFVLVAIALVVLLRNLLPRGAFAGPALLLTAGAALYTVQRGGPPGPVLAKVGPIVLVTVGVIVAVSRRTLESPLREVMERHSAILFPRREEPSRIPRAVAVRAVFGTCVIDYGGAVEWPLEEDAEDEDEGGAYDVIDSVEINVVLLWGRVELALPAHWTVVTGHIDATRAITFTGSLNPPHRRPADDGDEDGVSQWRNARNRVVLNVSGLGGSLSLTRPSTLLMERSESGRPIR